MSRLSLAVVLALAAVPLCSLSAWADPWCGGVSDSCSCGAGNPYPCCDNGGGKSGNCTWGAWHMACCNWGVGLPPPWQHAKYWAGNYAAHPDYDVLGSPVPGSIGCKATGEYGHVAWITGVSGGTVYTHEQSCCWGCHHGFADSSAGAGYFNGGYIVRAGTVWECQPGQQTGSGCGNCGWMVKTCQSNGKWGGWGPCDGQGPCAPGQVQSEACGDCGSHANTCGGNCQWSGWGGCAGPDPEGGAIPCDSGELGVCAEGRLRCVAGWKSCVALLDPSPEVCDGLDNDCEGIVDSGFPQEMGLQPPPFAARLADLSVPLSLEAHESAAAWADFANVGTQAWPAGGIWLKTEDLAGQASPLAPPGQWPAWDTAATLAQATPPGEVGRFLFLLRAPDEPGTVVVERLHLEGPDGLRLRCPMPELEIRLAITSTGRGNGQAEGSDFVEAADPSPAADPERHAADGGCSAAERGAQGTGAMVLALLIVTLLLAGIATATASRSASSSPAAGRRGIGGCKRAFLGGRRTAR